MKTKIMILALALMMTTALAVGHAGYACGGGADKEVPAEQT